MPVFLDFPIEFFRHFPELLLLVNGCDAVHSDAVGKGSFPLAMSVTEMDSLPLAQWAWVGFSIPTYASGKPYTITQEKNKSRTLFNCRHSQLLQISVRILPTSGAMMAMRCSLVDR